MPKLKTKQFTQHPEVQKCLNDLRRHFTETNKVVSDVLDDQGHQYVNLVQRVVGSWA